MIEELMEKKRSANYSSDHISTRLRPLRRTTDGQASSM